MQAPTAARVLHREPLPQHVGEQVVEAVPAAPVVERDHEEVVALELLEHPLAVGASGQRVGEVRRDPPRDADVEQEGGHLGRLPGQDLLDEVVGDRAQVAGQLAHGHIEVTAALQRQRGEPQAGRPPLRPVHQGLQLPGRQPDAVTFEQADGLGVVQAEVGGPQLGQLPRQPQPLQRQRQVGTGGQDQPQAAGAAPQGVGQGPQRRGADQLVPVVQHQCGGPGERLAGRQQPGDEAPVEGRRGRHRGERARGRDSPGALQRRQHVPPEARAGPRPPAPATATRSGRRDGPPRRRASASCPRRPAPRRSPCLCGTPSSTTSSRRGLGTKPAGTTGMQERVCCIRDPPRATPRDAGPVLCAWGTCTCRRVGRRACASVPRSVVLSGPSLRRAPAPG